jgi:hypothetical protein
MNISELDDALSAALHSLAAAQAVLRKSLPGRKIDVLRKADLDLPRASDAGDAASRPLALLEDAKRRVERLEAQRDLDAQHAPRPRYDEVEK